MNERRKVTDDWLYDRVFSSHWSLKMFQTADQACSGLALTRTGGHGSQQGTRYFNVHAMDENKGLCAAHRRI